MAFIEDIPFTYADSSDGYTFFDGEALEWVSDGTFRELKNGKTYFLAFADSNANLEKLPSIYTDDSVPHHIVQATSPQLRRWKGWSIQVEADAWIMHLWMKVEIVALEWEYL